MKFSYCWNRNWKLWFSFCSLLARDSRTLINIRLIMGTWELLWQLPEIHHKHSHPLDYRHIFQSVGVGRDCVSVIYPAWTPSKPGYSLYVVWIWSRASVSSSKAKQLKDKWDLLLLYTHLKKRIWIIRSLQLQTPVLRGSQASRNPWKLGRRGFIQRMQGFQEIKIHSRETLRTFQPVIRLINSFLRPQAEDHEEESELLSWERRAGLWLRAKLGFKTIGIKDQVSGEKRARW